MSGRKGETMTARKHEEASQAASCHQSMCGIQPLPSFHRRKQVGEPENAQAVGLRMDRPEHSWRRCWSGNTPGMSLPGLLKGRRLIWFLRLPNGIENARPNIGQGTDGNGMALALDPLALVILLGPGFLVGTLPGELVQGIAPGLDATQPPMRFLIRPALEENGRGSREGLQTAGTVVAAAVVAHFGQQSRSETRPSSWQSLEELPVGMTQKKALNLLIVVSNLLEKRFQLVYQGQHQPRFRAGRDCVGLQTRKLETRNNLLCFWPGSRISGLFEHRSHPLLRGGANCLQRRIGAQECKARGLLQLAEQLQHNRVIRFEASDELVDQASLHLDQCILVSGQGFEFLDQFAIGVEPTQVLEVGAPGFRQQIGVNGICLGTRGGTSPFHGSGIDRIDGPSLLQHMGNQQSMGRLNDASQVLFPSWSSDPLQIGVQLTQPFGAMSNTDRSQLTTLYRQCSLHHGARLPNQYRKTSWFCSFLETPWISELLCPYTVALEA